MAGSLIDHGKIFPVMGKVIGRSSVSGEEIYLPMISTSFQIFLSVASIAHNLPAHDLSSHTVFGDAFQTSRSLACSWILKSVAQGDRSVLKLYLWES